MNKKNNSELHKETLLQIEWNETKNEWLKKERGINFEKISYMIHNNEHIAIIPNINSKYYPEEMFILNIDNYIWNIPFYVKDGVVVLKTAFRNRQLNKIYNPKD